MNPRDYYAFCWGGQSRGTTRRVFNNIFVQDEGLPGLNFGGLKADDDFQADANLLWGFKDGPTQTADYFAKFRKSSLFEASKKQYPPGWGANDRLADLGPTRSRVDGGRLEHWLCVRGQKVVDRPSGDGLVRRDADQRARGRIDPLDAPVPGRLDHAVGDVIEGNAEVRSRGADSIGA